MLLLEKQDTTTTVEFNRETQFRASRLGKDSINVSMQDATRCPSSFETFPRLLFILPAMPSLLVLQYLHLLVFTSSARFLDTRRRFLPSHGQLVFSNLPGPLPFHHRTFVLPQTLSGSWRACSISSSPPFCYDF